MLGRPSVSFVLRRCVSPPGVGTGVNLRITVNRFFATSPLVWSYDAPVVSAISPLAADPNGDTVTTIIGFNFGPGRNGSSVAVGGRPCTVMQWNDTTVSCAAPAGVTSAAAVVVTVEGQRNADVAVVQYKAPVVGSFTPSLAPTQGGVAVVITGAWFADAAAVSVRVTMTRLTPQPMSMPCAVQAWNATSLVCIVPGVQALGGRL